MARLLSLLRMSPSSPPSAPPPAKRLRMSALGESAVESTVKWPAISGPLVVIQVGGLLRQVNDDGNVTFIAAPNETFHVHSSLLRAHSKYFRALLQDDPATAEYGHAPTIYLPDQDPAAFKTYVQYLYYNELNPTFGKYGKGRRLMQAYVLGECVGDSVFQDRIIDAMIAYCIEQKVVPNYPIINVVYNGTAEDSPARRLMVDLMVWAGSGTKAEVHKTTSKAHKDFIDDLLEALLTARPRPAGVRPWVERPESYHVGYYGIKGEVKKQDAVMYVAGTRKQG